jgi:hypothetical protein
MPTLQEVMGPHAYMFQRYGISPHEDVDTAVEKLQRNAPHLARLLKEAVFRGYPFFSVYNIYAGGGAEVLRLGATQNNVFSICFASAAVQIQPAAE